MPRGPLPQSEYEQIYAKVPRLTVELVLRDGSGVLLARRVEGPCAGLWTLPGGTVRYGEPLVEAIARVGRDELSVELRAGALLGYLEYPSHLAQGIDWPVGIAFDCELAGTSRLAEAEELRRWARLPEPMHDEQRRFLTGLVGG
jgi:ADP-ribose pyrophosphatase YjhB (NUDIX family)